MLYSLDTAKLDMIKMAMEKYPIACYSMNPSIAARDLADCPDSFLAHAVKIRELIGEDKEFYLQVVGETAEDMCRDAQVIVDTVKGNTFVKIPACPEGFQAIRMLKARGFRIACTAVLDVNQAILAAETGADIIAVYVNRLDSTGGDGIGVIEKIVKIYRDRGIRIPVCAASLKNVHYIERAALAGADCVTVTYEMLEQAATHSLTAQTLRQFKADWEGLYGVGTMIHNMQA